MDLSDLINEQEYTIQDREVIFEIKKRYWLIILYRFLQWAIFTLFYIYYHQHNTPLFGTFMNLSGLFMLIILVGFEWLVLNEVAYSFLFVDNQFIWLPTKELKFLNDIKELSNYHICVKDISTSTKKNICYLVLNGNKKFPWGKRKIVINNKFSNFQQDILIRDMHIKLNDMQDLLYHKNIESLVVYNKSFNANELEDSYPLFLLCSQIDDPLTDIVIAYNCISKKYYCYKVPKENILLEILDEKFTCFLVLDTCSFIGVSLYVEELIDMMEVI